MFLCVAEICIDGWPKGLAAGNLSKVKAMWISEIKAAVKAMCRIVSVESVEVYKWIVLAPFPSVRTFGCVS
jgi:hypothetical protein